MTPEELRITAHRIFDSNQGWMSKLADKLGVNRSTISRWAAGTSPIPTWQASRIRHFAAMRERDAKRRADVNED